MEIIMRIKTILLNGMCCLWFGIFLIGCIYIVEKAMQIQRQENNKNQTNENKMRRRKNNGSYEGHFQEV